MPHVTARAYVRRLRLGPVEIALVGQFSNAMLGIVKAPPLVNEEAVKSSRQAGQGQVRILIGRGGGRQALAVLVRARPGPLCRPAGGYFTRTVSVAVKVPPLT